MNDSRTEDPRDRAPEDKAPADTENAAGTPREPEGGQEPAADPGPDPATADRPDDASPELGDTVAPEPPHGHSAAPPHKERRSGGLGLLALVLALLAAGGTGYLYWLHQQEQATREAAGQRVAAAERELGDLRAELRADEAALQRRLDSLEEAQSERLERLRMLEEQVNAVGGRLQALEQVDAGPERAPSLAELEYLLLLADRELQLADNPRVALAALREADRRLARMEEPALAPVRAAVNDEIAAVEAVAGVDRAGVAMRLDSLADRIEGLPLRGSLAPPPADGGTGADAGASGWDRFVARVRGAAAGLFRIRRSDEPAAPLLAPDESFFLYRNVELDLKSARLAALAQDSANYAAGLASARASLNEYFEVDDPAVAAVLEAVAELQGREVEPQWPDISRSLTLLRTAGAGG